VGRGYQSHRNDKGLREQRVVGLMKIAKACLKSQRRLGARALVVAVAIAVVGSLGSAIAQNLGATRHACPPLTNSGTRPSVLVNSDALPPKCKEVLDAGR
jgi:hypothetical protein